jgi:acyl carrier protein
MLENRLLKREKVVGDEESLLLSGVIDSLAILELTAFIEERYSCSVKEDDLVPENFDSLAAMSAFIGKKLGAGA